MNNTVFISYRHSDGAEKAQLVASTLRNKHYSVFLDKMSLRSGKFPEQLRENIINCTDFIMIISNDYFSDRINKNDDWVRQEIALALKTNKNIIPYIFNGKLPSISALPKNLTNILEYQALRYNLTPLYDSNDELLSSYIKSKPTISSTDDELANLSSIYDATFGDELKRLQIQANRSKKNDERLLNKHLNTKSNLSVLDVGCAYGYLGQERFKSDNFTHVVGIDKNMKCIRYANSHYANYKFVYEHVDLEAENFENTMIKIIEKNQIKEFDLIFISQVLHHLANPIKVLRTLRKYLKTNGLIYIREPDDGSKISSDPILDKIILLTQKISGCSNRFYARNIYGHLCDSGFSNIRIYCFPDETSQKTFDEKVLHFKEGYSFRINYARKLYRTNPTEENKKILIELETLLAKFEEKFYSNNFWYCGQSYIGIGYKDK